MTLNKYSILSPPIKTKNRPLGLSQEDVIKRGSTSIRFSFTRKTSISHWISRKNGIKKALQSID
ncbi:hypothetical protein RV11_GL001960 [Enterococcus phoeniculicola]|nr:hypothetical protein RV11_GL001960 [Enterococcus phoeniculicola]